MADVYGSFYPAFYLAGASCTLAAVMLFFIPCIKEEEHETTKQRLEFEDSVVLVSERETVL